MLPISQLLKRCLKGSGYKYWSSVSAFVLDDVGSKSKWLLEERVLNQSIADFTK